MNAAMVSAKRQKERWRTLVSQLKKLTLVTTKDSKGVAIVVRPEDVLTLADVVKWREAETTSLRGVSDVSFASLPPETKEKVQAVIDQLEKREGKANRPKGAALNLAYENMLAKLIEAGIVTNRAEFEAQFAQTVEKDGEAS